MGKRKSQGKLPESKSYQPRDQERNNDGRQSNSRRGESDPNMDMRSFRDLSVYQESQAIALQIIKVLGPQLSDATSGDSAGVLENLTESALSIPVKIAQSSGARLRDRKLATDDLFEVTQTCSRMMVYLDQASEIFLEDQEAKDLAQEILRRIFLLRVKTVNLLKTWVEWNAERKPSYSGQGQRYSNQERDGYRERYQEQRGGALPSQNNRGYSNGGDRRESSGSSDSYQNRSRYGSNRGRAA